MSAQFYIGDKPIQAAHSIILRSTKEAAKNTGWSRNQPCELLFTIQDNPRLASFKRDMDLQEKQKKLACIEAYMKTIYYKPQK